VRTKKKRRRKVLLLLFRWIAWDSSLFPRSTLFVASTAWSYKYWICWVCCRTCVDIRWLSADISIIFVSVSWTASRRLVNSTWRALVSSSNSCSWTLMGAADTSWSPIFDTSDFRTRLDLDGSASLISDFFWIFFLGIALLIASWKRMDRSRSNCAVTEWRRSLKIKTTPCWWAIKSNRELSSLVPSHVFAFPLFSSSWILFFRISICSLHAFTKTPT